MVSGSRVNVTVILPLTYDTISDIVEYVLVHNIILPNEGRAVSIMSQLLIWWLNIVHYEISLNSEKPISLH